MKILLNLPKRSSEAPCVNKKLATCSSIFFSGGLRSDPKILEPLFQSLENIKINMVRPVACKIVHRFIIMLLKSWHIICTIQG
jgi:hypothetical protein